MVTPSADYIMHLATVGNSKESIILIPIIHKQVGLFTTVSKMNTLTVLLALNNCTQWLSLPKWILIISYECVVTAKGAQFTTKKCIGATSSASLMQLSRSQPVPILLAGWRSRDRHCVPKKTHSPHKNNDICKHSALIQRLAQTKMSEGRGTNDGKMRNRFRRMKAPSRRMDCTDESRVPSFQCLDGIGMGTPHRRRRLRTEENAVAYRHFPLLTTERKWRRVVSSNARIGLLCWTFLSSVGRQKIMKDITQHTLAASFPAILNYE